MTKVSWVNIFNGIQAYITYCAKFGIKCFELSTHTMRGGGVMVFGVKLFGIWGNIWDLRLINLNILSEIHILFIYKILDIG